MTHKHILERVAAGTLSHVEAYTLITRGELEHPSDDAEPTAKAASEAGIGPIAVIGMSARLPGAADLDEFWQLLRDGRSAITEVPRERWDPDLIYDPEPTARGRSYARHGGFIADIDKFDARFFRVSPREAKFLDPQQRVFMQECWRALESAGYAAGELAGSRTGVFVGCKGADYQLRLQTQDLAKLDVTDSHLFGGNDISMLPARMAYFLDLRGPAVPINTACSSSLVALHMACESLASGQCELAIAAGVEFMTTPGLFVSMASSEALSRTGSCNAFSDDSDGLVLGEGACVVVLKPLAQALADGDQVRGIIRASGINQDGKSAGINAPNGDAQTKLEIAVYERAGINPAELDYVEAHGTGTALGDPIEFHALSDAFRHFTAREAFCPIGTVKTNIGHPLSAAGLAGLIKVLLSLEHEQLPPSLNFRGFNRLIDADGSPFFVNTQLRAWPRSPDRPRLAALSSFGFSGTNAHVVVEEAPPRPSPADRSRRPELILVSAKTEAALRAKLRELGRWCRAQATSGSLTDLAYTLHRGREHFQWRAAWVVDGLSELAEVLERGAEQPSSWREAAKKPESAKRALASQLERLLAAKAELDERARRGTLVALADLYLDGLTPDWAALYDPARVRRVPAPVYPFEGRSYWLDAPTRALLWPPVTDLSEAREPELPAAPRPSPSPTTHPSARPIETCYLRPIWLPLAAPSAGPGTGDLLVFDDEGGLSERLRALAPGRRVIRVRRAPGEGSLEADELRCDGAPGSVAALVERLEGSGARPGRVVFAWPEQAAGRGASSSASPEDQFLLLLELCRALLASAERAPVQLLVPHTHADGLPRPELEAIAAFARTIASESQRVACRCVGFADEIDVGRLLAELDDLAPELEEVRWIGDQRQRAALERWTPTPTRAPALRRGGVYLLVGGSGGIGRQLARSLAREFAAKLMLAGRSAPGPDMPTQLLGHEGEGEGEGEIHYHQCDVTKLDEVEALVDATKRRFGRIDGVLHLAGVLADSLVANKTREQARAVLRPKLLGLLNLDQATRFEPLDLFVGFSSLAARRGNPGQSDYAYANAYIDGFMRAREHQRRAGARRGASVAIDWPQWAGEGMSLSAEDREIMRSLGLAELETDEGFAALRLLLRCDEPVVAVCRGEPEAVEALVVQAQARPAAAAAVAAEDGGWRELVPELRRLLVEIFAEVTELPIEEVDTSAAFEEFGVDSVMVKSLNVKLVRELGELPKTLMFECQTLDEVATYLAQHHGAELERRLRPAPVEGRPRPEKARAPQRRAEPLAPAPRVHRGRGDDEPIAIVGLGGRYPGARDLDQLWRNLCEGHDAITEVPPSRWSLADYYDPDPAAAARGKMYCKWGGFLDDIDRFDARFFRISPREAETMDPQERLFLECAWQTFEDSGYRFPLASPSAAPPVRDVGVFVGVTTNTYQLLGPEQWLQGKVDALPNSSPWSIANRVSYLFGLHGPSMTIDTACSSSLVAIHLACESLQRRECELALVGGVNLYTHPSKYVVMCRMHMLSRRGRCHAFGALGDGFVPGEGVGAVVLKPYSAALADGDHIRALIRGSAVNHGGKTTSYTVPSPRAQAKLIETALARAGVEPESISYVEAHGTGTELGDPVELRGLEAAYGEAESECAVASLKSNIGHLEAAAGIAGLTKLVLQLGHRTLVPSLHADELNPNLALDSSRFRIQRERGPWTIAGPGPRRAGLSSFGAGGTNAHVVVEEFVDEFADKFADKAGHRPSARESAQLLVLSAADDERLRARAEALLARLEREPPIELCDLAYTLQVGRVALPVRFAAEVDSLAAAAEALRALLAGRLDDSRQALGKLEGGVSGRGLSELLDGPEGAAFVEVALRQRRLAKLGKLWTRGVEIDWAQLHDGPRRRVSLPSYPFAGKRYWFAPREAEGASVARLAGGALGPHPMLAANRSTLRGLAFALALDPKAHWFRDHEVLGQLVIPGVGLLEAARAAGSLAAESPVTRLRRVVWLEPLALTGEDQQALVRLQPRDRELDFEVESATGQDRKLHARGTLDLRPLAGERPRLELDGIRARCEAALTGGALYPDDLELEAGVAPPVRIGPSLRSLRELWIGRDELLVRLEQPPGAGAGQLLNIAIFDGAVQATAAFEGVERRAARSMFPLSIDELRIHAPLPSEAFAHLRVVSRTGDGGRGTVRFDIAIAERDGRVAAELRGYVARTIATATPGAEAAPRVLLEPAWKLTRLERAPASRDAPALLLLGGSEELRGALARRLGDAAVVRVEAAAAFVERGPRDFGLRPGEPDDYARLFERLGAAGLEPRWIALDWVRDWAHESAGEGTPADADAVERGPFALHALAAGLRGAAEPDAARRVLILTRSPAGRESPSWAALGAFARAANQERGPLTLTRIDLCDSLGADALAKLMIDEWRARPEPELRYRDGLRHARVLEELPSPGREPEGEPWRLLPDDAHVVIAGGRGGLGAALARSLASSLASRGSASGGSTSRGSASGGSGRLLLLGRSAADEPTEALLEDLRARGVEACYAAVDLAEREQLIELLADQRARWGPFSAVIHAAGVLWEGYLGRRPRAQIQEVLAARVHGTLALDEATADDPLACFLLCSSFSAVLGSPAQSDAAYAHAFMDQFARARAEAVASGSRRGHTLAINWPLWQVGRVGDVDPAVIAWLERTLGVRRLSPASGLELLDRALASGRPQVAVLEGDGARIRSQLLDRARPTTTAAPASPPPTGDAPRPSTAPSSSLASEVVGLLQKVAADLIRLPVDELGVDMDLSELGFESVSTIDFTNTINDTYGIDAMPTMFFECRTLREVAERLIAEYPAPIESHHRRGPARLGAGSGPQEPSFEAPAPVSQLALAPEPAFASAPGFASSPFVAAPRPASAGDEPIAIVGMSGAMPGSEDLDEFWANLIADRELIAEVPPERWSWEDHVTEGFAPRWAGLMKHIDRFDPLFWGISPREAALMDPQHRLTLEHTWRALEDGGIRPSSLARSRTGVFVGVANSDYADLIRERIPTLEAHGALGVSQCILPNRISFLLDLRGPSEPVNTGCSSAVVAIHRAVEAIRSDDCELAIAAGVHVLLNPLLPAFFGLAGAHSDDHRLRAFDRGATGTLLGEGVGVVVLKPLSKALADGNPIHALIRATAENHGGKASSLTAPNPDAQVELLESVYTRAELDPETIGYIEAHGTGTLLGDPIELGALRKAFARLHELRGRPLPSTPTIPVSSVKSNVGHLMTAAGIASVLKVVLAFAHETQPGTRHFEALNPFVDLSRSPFEVRGDHRPWPAPVDASGTRQPRRAGVSSFGMGGANAHLILEEHLLAEHPRPLASGPQLVVLSAQSEDRLRARVEQLAVFLQQDDSVELAELAWTLQHAREPMDRRLALLVRDLDELKARLQLVLAGQDHGEIWRTPADDQRRPAGDELGPESIERLLAARELGGLARLWCAGAEIDWSRLLNSGPRPRLLHLPSYPFAPMRCWLDERGQTIFEVADTRTPSAPEPAGPASTEPASASASPGPGEEPPLLYYGFSWREAPATQAVTSTSTSSPSATLVFEAGGLSLGDSLDATEVLESAHPQRLRSTLESLRERGRLPEQVVITSGYAGDLVDTLFFLLRAYASLNEKRRLRRLVVAHALAGELPDPRAEAVAGYAAALPALFPNLRLTLVGLDADARARERELLARELILDDGAELRHVQGRRERRRAQRIEPISEPAPPFGPRPVVVITGGAGGLGLIFARHFASRHHARLALLGRSPLDERKQQALDELRRLGGEAVYLAADVADRVQLGRALAATRERFGPIECVLHSAGVANQIPLTDKEPELFRATLAPKLDGTELLDELTADDPLELFALFSSTSVQFGDMGQGDYAVGNRFMDSFAAHRARLGRPGRSLAINWPLWREGGFRLRDADEEAALEFSGMVYLEIEDGLAAFERMRAWPDYNQVVVVATKQRERIEHFLGLRSGPRERPPSAGGAPARSQPSPSPAVASERPQPAPRQLEGELSERLVTRLRELASSILDLPVDQLDPEADLVRFGLDSIKVAEFISALNEAFPELDLSQAEMFGRQTINELAELLLDEHEHAIQVALGGDGPATPASEPRRRRPRELVEIQVPSETRRPPSFWVPGSYGFSQSFTALPEVLGPSYPIYAFHARGNDGKRMPFARHEDMVAHYLECAREVHPGGPWLLGGYSFGGLVALEMARQLELAGETVGGLVLFDTYPPTQWIYDMTQREADVELMMVVLANYLAGAKEFEEVIHLEDLEGVPQRLYIARLVELIVERGSTRLSPDELFGIFRGSSEVNDYASEVYRRYDPPPYTASKVLYVRSGVGLDHYIADYDYVGVWRELIPRGLEVVEVPFGHAELMDKPALELVKDRLVSFLEL